MGACIAIFIAYSFRIVAMNFLYIRELNIDIKEFFASTFIKISPWHLVTIIFGLIIRRVIPITNGKLIFLVTSTAIVFVYTFLSFCFSMNADERSAIRKILKRKVKK
jgi:hypothetical protein